MHETSRLIPIVSAATLALVISQGVFAETATPEASPAEAVPASEPAAVAAPASPAEAARAQAEERRAAMMAEREKRYEELRASAAEIGLALPETPPWLAAPAMPEPPPMPERFGMSPEDLDAMREQRRAMMEKMRSMSPEERRAMREAHWEQMRADAAERGIEMPETPPWVEAEQRRKAMEEQLEQYRQTIDAMTEEQLEAARVLFGSPPPMPEFPPMPKRMPHKGYGHGPYGGHPGGMPYGADPRAMGYGPMMPYYGAPSMPQDAE